MLGGGAVGDPGVPARCACAPGNWSSLQRSSWLERSAEQLDEIEVIDLSGRLRHKGRGTVMQVSRFSRTRDLARNVAERLYKYLGFSQTSDLGTERRMLRGESAATSSSRTAANRYGHNVWLITTR